MFSAIWNWFRNLFSNKVVAELVVKDLAVRTFMRRPPLALQAMKWCNYVLDSIRAESANSLDSLETIMLGYIAKMNLTVEEKVLMTTLAESLQNQLALDLKKSGITESLKQMGKAAEYIEWIMDAAKAASAEK